MTQQDPNSSVDGCVFCARLAGDDFWLPVAESAHSVAALANHQRTPGSVIVIPRRHAFLISQLSEEEAIDLQRMIRRMIGTIERAYDPVGMHVWQGGRLPENADRPPHIHARICPRFPDVPYTFAPNEDLQPTQLSELQAIREALAAADDRRAAR